MIPYGDCINEGGVEYIEWKESGRFEKLGLKD